MMTEPAHQPRTVLDYALAYVARQWAVVPLHGIDADGRCTCGDAHTGVEGSLSPGSKGKHPHTLFAPHGALSATKDPETVRRWFADGRLNVGIATGEASGVVAVDIDPRDGGDDTWSHFLDLNRARVPDTVIASTGGGGQHILFQYQPDSVIRTPGKGIQVKGNGGYIVVEPSRHHSGNAYSWEAEADPLDGANPAPAPAWLSSPKKAELLGVSGRAVGHLHPQRIADLRAALRHIDPDPYQDWLQVGMALHSTEAAEAFELWASWSADSAKFDQGACVRKWNSFTAGNGLHVESIFSWAQARGWTGETERVAVPMPAEGIQPRKVAPSVHAPEHLLAFPGVLNDFVRWTNQTAPKPQPQFAVQAAIALGATVMGRIWRTSRHNYPSLYLVNVGRSGSGKEHARTAIESTLDAAGLTRLIGPGGYTSDSAVLSELLLRPCHLSIIDEIGDMLKNAKAQGNHHRRQSISMLIQAWGQLHGTIRPLAYSTMGLSKRQRDDLDRKVIHNPALTMLGMTTPKGFYDGLTEAAIEGGFLNRLLVVESEIGPQPRGDALMDAPPAAVVEWCKRVAQASGATGNLAGVDLGPEIRIEPRVVPINSEAEQLFRAYDLQCIDAMNRLEREGLAEMEGRSVEKAMRIALIAAVSINLASPVVDAVAAQWAIDYVRAYTAQTTSAIRRNMHGSLFGQWRATTLEVIVKAGARGATERELSKASRTFAGLDPRTRKAVFDALVAEGEIAFMNLGKGTSGRGSDREAWVALPDSEGEPCEQ